VTLFMTIKTNNGTTMESFFFWLITNDIYFLFTVKRLTALVSLFWPWSFSVGRYYFECNRLSYS
jgi:hypothetical protein